MSMLSEIQSSLMQEETGIGSILLKLRFLASRLGSDLLEDWVKHETEGYPKGVAVPDYRKVGITYTASFSDIATRIQNAPIPSYLIKKHAGDQWVTHEVRDSMAAVDDLIRISRQNDSSIGINASNLILLLQGKVYPGMTCHSVSGALSTSALVGLQSSVRSHVLELTIELEKTVPAAADIEVGPRPIAFSANDTDRVTYITNQAIYGNYTEISISGSGAQFTLTIGERDSGAFTKALVQGGIAEPDAAELAEIVATEEPEGKDEPFGVRAKDWISKNIGKAVNGVWKVSLSVAEELLREATLRYYGLK